MIFKNLNGIILLITTRYNNLYTYDVHVEKEKMEIPNSDSSFNYKFIGGFSVELFHNLKDLLGFEYKLVPDVGTYNFSLAVNKSIDLFVGSYSVYPERTMIVNPTFVIGHSKIVALINHEFESNLEDIFTLPFSRQLWFGILSLLLLYILEIIVIGRGEKWSFLHAIFCAIAVILQKECRINCTTISCRMACFVMSVSLVVIMACYVGNMFSMKAVHRFILTTMEAVVGSNYKILIELGGAENQSTIMRMLEAMQQIPLVKNLLDRIRNANYIYQTFEKVIVEVQERPTAYIIDEETGMSTISSVIGQFPCSWSSLPVLNLKYPWVMFMRKNSLLKDSINYGLLRLDESGLTKRLRRKWIPYAPACKAALSFTSICLEQVYPAFGVYFVGLVVAIGWCVLVETKYFLRKCFSLKYYKYINFHF